MDTIDINNILNNCKTGDLLLYSSKNWIASLIEYFTDSKFSHVSMIIKNPTYINPDLKGLFVIESGTEPLPDPEDNTFKYGVQLTPLEEIINQYQNGKLGKLYYRKLDCLRTKNFYKNIKKIHEKVHNKPYDLNILDWLKSGLHIQIGNERKTSEFWCSALIAYIYSNLGFINEKVRWSTITPKEFSYYEDNDDLKFKNCILNREKLVDFKILNKY